MQFRSAALARGIGLNSLRLLAPAYCPFVKLGVDSHEPNRRVYMICIKLADPIFVETLVNAIEAKHPDVIKIMTGQGVSGSVRVPDTAAACLHENDQRLARSIGDATLVLLAFDGLDDQGLQLYRRTVLGRRHYDMFGWKCVSF